MAKGNIFGNGYAFTVELPLGVEPTASTGSQFNSAQNADARLEAYFANDTARLLNAARTAGPAAVAGAQIFEFPTPAGFDGEGMAS